MKKETAGERRMIGISLHQPPFYQFDVFLKVGSGRQGELTALQVAHIFLHKGDGLQIPCTADICTPFHVTRRTI